MVTLQLFNRFGTISLYHYWPEGSRSHLPGVVRMSSQDGKVELVEPAELDKLLYFVREGALERPVWQYFEAVRHKLVREL